MTTTLTAVRSVLAAGIPPVTGRHLEQAVAREGAVSWSAFATVAQVREQVAAGAIGAAPDVLVIGYNQRDAWSVLVLLGQLFQVRGSEHTRVLLVTDRPRAALPVHLTDEPRLDVVGPDDVEARLYTVLHRLA